VFEAGGPELPVRRTLLLSPSPDTETECKTKTLRTS